MFSASVVMSELAVEYSATECGSEEDVFVGRGGWNEDAQWRGSEVSFEKSLSGEVYVGVFVGCVDVEVGDG